MYYRRSIIASSTVDPFIANGIFSVCWLAAVVGSAILQLRLMARTPPLVLIPLHPAMVIALLAFCWTLGGLCGMCWLRRGSASLWGVSGLLGWGSLWLLSPLLQSLKNGVFPALASLLIPLVFATVLGGLNTAWISAMRPCSLGMRTNLISSVLPIAALVVAWFMPAWADYIGIVALLPLIVLDCIPPDQLSGIVQPATKNHQLETQSLPSWWWWKWLKKRNQFVITLVSLGMSITLGTLFSVIPTALAMQLTQAHQQVNLLWALTGQILSLFICLGILEYTRGIIGAPDCPFPKRWHGSAKILLYLAFIGIAGSLIGISFSHASWLVLSFAGYSMAFTCWSIIVPRLFPRIRSQHRARQQLVPFQWLCNDDDRRSLYSQLLERKALEQMALWQRILTCSAIPLVGASIVRFGIATTLLFSGILLLVFAGIVCLLPPLLRS